MQSLSEATEQAKDTVRRYRVKHALAPDSLSAAEREELLDAMALIERTEKISRQELRLRIDRGRL